MREHDPLRNEIASVLQRGMIPLADDVFNSLASRVFAFQFHNNSPYRKYCERRGVAPPSITHWLDIPAVPTAAFKEAALVTGDVAHAEAQFRTSGTTQGSEKRGVHYVLDLALYRQSLLPPFRRLVLADRSGESMASLVPEWRAGGESSLSYMTTTVMRELGAPDSWCAMGVAGIDHVRLEQWLRAKCSSAEPVCLIGTSLAFVHWFDRLRADNAAFSLPAGSRVMDTGGFKGSQRSVGSAELREQYTALLGIPPHLVINEYGMTEMLSQFYDVHRAGAEAAVKQGPPWVRSAVVHPDTLQPLAQGETGLLRHFDLANLFSVAAIQTEDLARVHADGFELLGRAAGATPRGCSIAMDMFLSAAR